MSNAIQIWIDGVLVADAHEYELAPILHKLKGAKRIKVKKLSDHGRSGCEVVDEVECDLREVG